MSELAAPVQRRRSHSAWAVAGRRFIRNPMAIGALLVVLLMVLAAAFGPNLWIYTHTDITDALTQPPSRAHPFGTDVLGHDMLALVLRGLRQSLSIAFMVAVPATLVGVTAGVVAGFAGGTPDNIIMRLVDLILTIPSMALATFLGAQLRGVSISTLTLSAVLAALLWTSMARLVRGITIKIKNELFIDAARLMGESAPRIILRHVIPNVVDQVIVSVTLLTGTAVLAESGLSFLGVGVRPPDTSLGLLVSNAKDAAMTRPWMFYFPGLAILVFVLAINFLGESIRVSLNPHRRTNNYLAKRATGRGRRRAVLGQGVATHPVPAAGPLPSDPPPAVDALLEIDHLTVGFPLEDILAVDDVSATVEAGEIVALVGESGSGKTMTVSSVMGLLPTGAEVSGDIRFAGRSLSGLDYNQWRSIRGSQISIILQDPMTSLNPVLTVFTHFRETMRAIQPKISDRDVREQAVALMTSVGITRPTDRLDQYPHELSGGMRQRVVIALAIVGQPKLIIADEPTTALDVTVQARVLDSLEAARSSINAAMIFITHDLALVAGFVDRVLVMKDGRIVEAGPVDRVFAQPQHDYTRSLLARIPRLTTTGGGHA